MPISAGGCGSSTGPRVKVSESRIDPPERLVAVERGDDRPELRAALLSAQRDAQRTEVAADRLQLADERAGLRLVEPLRGASAELAEALQGQRSGNRDGRHRPNLLARGRD